MTAMQPEAPAMEATGLRLACDVGFGAFHLAVDVALPANGLTALLGPSGSGKTTLLRIAAGLARKPGARVDFAGESWQDDAKRLWVPPHRRGIGFVFQDGRLFPHLDVAGNLRFGLTRRTAAQRRLGFEQVVAALDLAPLLGRGTATLSGGETQRVAIGRALLMSPRLLLLDEPLAALDLGRRAEILPLIERIRDDLGVPMVYVTHTVAEAARLASHVVVLADGRIAATGTPHQTLGHLAVGALGGPAEAGSVICGKIAGHDARYGLMLIEAGGHVLRVAGDGTARNGQPVRLRVRARDVALAKTRPTQISIRNILPARVAAIRAADATFAEVELMVVPPTGAESATTPGDTDDTPPPRLIAHVTREAIDDLALVPDAPVFALIKALALDAG